MNLVVAVPPLLGSPWLVGRTSLRGHFFWMGAAGWLAYVGVIDAFRLEFNPLATKWQRNAQTPCPVRTILDNVTSESGANPPNSRSICLP